MSLGPKHDHGATRSSTAERKYSNVTDRLHAAANTPTSAVKQTSHTKNMSGQKDVYCLDRFMQNTDSKVLKQGRKDQKGT